ncbi:MAG TPA: HAD family hydrolase [Opitutales bacterium]|nr:HAD family hydrolase [Opitutales bacterium]
MQKSSAPIKAILYDLDGTLVDNFRAIQLAINYAEEALGLPPSTHERVRSVVGGGIELTLTRLVGAGKMPRALPLYHERFAQVMFEGLTPCPGAVALLRELHARGVRQAVLTNKHGEGARAVIRHLGWNPWFELVLGTHDTPWRKPQGVLGLHAVEKLGTFPGDTVMIGDSPFDLDTAANTGLRGYAVTTGSHTRAQLLAHQPPPAGVYDSLIELGAEVFGLTLAPP